jgi:DNA modification methylase
LVYNVVARKLTYEENDFKGEIVNIYQKPQELINYLIDTFSNEGDWVLDLFSRFR